MVPLVLMSSNLHLPIAFLTNAAQLTSLGVSTVILTPVSDRFLIVALFALSMRAKLASLYLLVSLRVKFFIA